LLISSFQSTSLRTAGFATVAQDGMTEASKLICSLLMMIGGSPGGTAGGVKTVTLAIILCSVWSIVKGRTEIVAFERSVSVATLQRALAVAVLMISLLFIGTTILAMTEDAAKFPHTLSDLIFEVSSALGTVGLSTGITPRLSAAGKIVLMACMFIGRIGPITLIASISRGPQIGKELIRYQKEDVMIG
jgi:trk system potassium uptake protein TrkH